MTEPIKEWPRDQISLDCSVPEPGEGHAWIQWKGTEVCMDVHCRCGHHGHVDAEFAYFYKCPKCHITFCVGQTVRLYPIAAGCEDIATPGCTVTSSIDDE